MSHKKFINLYKMYKIKGGVLGEPWFPSKYIINF